MKKIITFNFWDESNNEEEVPEILERDLEEAAMTEIKNKLEDTYICGELSHEAVNGKSYRGYWEIKDAK